MQLQDHDTVVGEPTRRRLDKAPVGVEAVAGRKDRGERLALELRMIRGARRGEVRQVGDDHVDQTRHRAEQIAAADDDTVLEPMAADVFARERDSTAARVRRPKLGAGAQSRERDGDRPRASTDVGDASVAYADSRGGGLDELLARRSRRHHAPWRAQQPETIEADVTHASFVSPAGHLLPATGARGEL